MESQDFRARRSEFIPEPEKRDFSGEDFRSLYFGKTSQLDHSYFNGIFALDCAFDGSDLSNVEMAEAQLENCVLYEVDLSGSDFVGSRFVNVEFISCQFDEGEWRDSYFIGCKFKNCSLTHTTVNLCVFDGCEFCAVSSVHFEQLCINYNTFLGCVVSHRVENEVVLSRNFALPAARRGHCITPTGRGMMLEHVCLASGFEDFNIEALATALENELGDSGQRRMRKLRIEFIVNVISQLALHRLISASSLIYIESIFTHFARSAIRDTDLMIAMSAMMIVRNAIFEATQTDEDLPDGSARCIAIGVTYEADLDLEDAENLAHLLTCAIAVDGVRVITQSVRKGSLIIDYVINGSLTFAMALMAVNFALAQATKTVNHLGNLKKGVVAVVASPKSRRKSSRSSAKLPAIERNGGLAKELEPARKAVHKMGKRVARLDRSAKVRFDLDR